MDRPLGAPCHVSYLFECVDDVDVGGTNRSMRRFDPTQRKTMAGLTRDGTMIDDMGIFRTDMEIAPLDAPGRRVGIRDVMVDTGSEYNWVQADLLAPLGIAPVRVDRFETADGRVLERQVGFVMLYAG